MGSDPLDAGAKPDLARDTNGYGVTDYIETLLTLRIDIDGDGEKDLVAEFTNGKTSLYQSKTGSWSTLIDPAWGVTISQDAYLPRSQAAVPVDTAVGTRMDIESLSQQNAGTKHIHIYGELANPPKTQSLLPKI
jgi:hypothetical protein